MSLSVARHGRTRVRDALGAFDAVNRTIETSDWSAERLHELRIAGKKLRYTMEIFLDANPSLGEPLARLVRLQEVLGDLQDADVGIAASTDYPRRTAPARAAAGFTREQLAVRRQECLRDWSQEFPDDVRRALITEISRAAK